MRHSRKLVATVSLPYHITPGDKVLLQHSVEHVAGITVADELRAAMEEDGEEAVRESLCDDGAAGRRR